MSVQILPATAENIEAAARVLRAGGIVAFPTETVYGLAANALDTRAVAKIFEAKGRPSTNPLIVHVADVDAARALAAEWPAVADTLAARFWPGPLTIVVEKTNAVPSIVTANGFTVGVRIPSHLVALDLLRACGLPLAAPSANRSEEVSPTTAQHVADSLGPHVTDLLILGDERLRSGPMRGPCAVGIESTVVDVTTMPPCVLRPGMITSAMLSDALGVQIGSSQSVKGEALRSPGQMTRHYAPRKPLLVVSENALPDVLKEGDGVWFRSVEIPPTLPSSVTSWKGIIAFIAPTSAARYAHALYHKLRVMDAAPNIKRIIIVEPPHTTAWEAIHDRLQRASAK